MIKKALKPQKSLWGAGGKMSMKEILKGLRMRVTEKTIISPINRQQIK